MIRIPGCYRPSSYFPSSRLVNYRTGLFVGGTALLLLLLVPGSLSVFAQRGTAVAPVLLSIAVTPADASILPDRDIQFTATGTYSDGSTDDLTCSVTWSSSVPAAATINRVGAATARAVGRTTIEAALGAINGSATLNVVLGGLFDLTGSMGTARTYGTATLLNNGMVLVAGGFDWNELASAELYDPVAQIFTYTDSMNTIRVFHTATLLNNGMVLMAGGQNESGPLAIAELYDPATGTFIPTGSLNSARFFHTATLLENGKVLIAGGSNNENAVFASAELYDPATGTFAPTGSMNTPRWGHTATLLNNGMALVAGAGGLVGPDGTADLYNPATGTFTPTGSLNTARYTHTATLLNNGMVLIAGGYYMYQYETIAEVYDPATGTFTPTISRMNSAHYLQPSTLLNNGMVLMAGGIGGIDLIVSSAELYEPVLCPPPDLESIAITPATSTLSPGETQRFIAMGKFSDGTTQQLASVTWSSSNPAVAQISNDASNPGVGLAVAAGTVMIEARAVWVRGWAKLTVR